MINQANKKWTLIAGMAIVIGIVLLFGYCAASKNKAPSKSYSACGITLPKPHGWVNDFVSLYLPAEKLALDSLIERHEHQFSDEIAIVTLDQAMLGNCELDEYTLSLARAWGMGKKIKNNGILIGIAPGLRKIRIENGYGIEKILSNDDTKQIIDSVMIPHFKNADFYEGTRQGLFAIFKKISEKK